MPSLSTMAGARHIVSVADEAHHHVLAAANILDGPLNLLNELGRGGGLFVDVGKRRHHVAQPGPLGVAFLVAQLAQGLHAADLHAADVIGDDHFALPQDAARLVVPHLHLDAAVE
ncbi:MAG: hypothetical protein ACO3IJ_06335 [Steroidobacteraceae bacterium]